MKQTFIVGLIYKYKKKHMLVLFNCSYLKYFLVNVLYATVQCETFSFKSPCNIKVENILKGGLDSIPSHSISVKIQIMSGKVCLRCKGKTVLGDVNKLLKTKSLLTSPSNVLPYHLKETFLPIFWIFNEIQGDGIESRLSS